MSPRVLPRRARDRVIAGILAVLVLAGLVVYFAVRAPAGYRVENRTITVRTGPHRNQPVPLDTSLYVPDSATAAAPAPAVLLAHGLGQSKTSVASQAKELAGRGYVVLAWTAEGFGKSGGQIHLDSPDWEVTDAGRLVDWLSHRPEVRQDKRGDPRVGALGGSYGGALSLLLAARDGRVDAIVPQITWNDLARSLFPESGGGGPADGVLKRAWLGALFADGLSAGGKPGCGRFAADVCRMYRQVVTSGRATPEAVSLLRRNSPASVLGRIHAPTLLVQGLADTLFPLSEADANARGIAAAGTPVQVAWFSGGHDGGQGSDADHDRVRFLTGQWLDHYLRGVGPKPDDTFTFSRVIGYDRYDNTVRTTALSTTRYPGLSGRGSTVRVSGPPQRVANPPDGTPAGTSTLPGIGIAGVSPGTEIPGQAALFQSATLPDAVDLTGAPRVRLRVGTAASTGSTAAPVLFAKLYDVGPDGKQTLVAGQTAPVRLAHAGTVSVTLPGMVYRFQSGHRIRLVVDTADQAYAGPREPATYTVAVAGGLTVPTLAATPLGDPAGIWYWVLLAVVVLIALAVATALVVARVRRRRRTRTVVTDLADTPLSIRGLRKTYSNGVLSSGKGDGFVAVQGIDFTVHRGQVVGLLGPNGAGKTTSLRMLLGLIRPTAGEVLVFGHRITAGAPVLSRIGSLVEGPGFLPHLSGVDNLRLYWRATGRPADTARFDEVLAIADLGDAVHRRVRTYSHGMKQRLAIAQAMLGLPDLLVLDEPTDGLDPPQIAEMRRVLQRYATDGRSVLVSSHLLAEVEQTCTHVVVMRRGELVAAGPVDDIIGDSPSVLLSVSDVDTAEPVLRGLSGVTAIARQNGGLVVELTDLPRRELVDALVSAGVGVDRVVPRRRLEDAFLALLERGGLMTAATDPANSVSTVDGSAVDYRPAATLRVGTEIRRQLSRRRTQLVLGFLVVLPVILFLAFQFGTDGNDAQSTDQSGAFVTLAKSGAANFTVFTLAVSASFLLVVVVALFCGDTVASEASWGSLRYLLAAPVPRSRLLGVKMLVALLYSGFSLVLLTGVSLLVGAAAFGWHPLRTMTGDSIEPAAAVLRIAGVVGYLAITLLVAAGLAFLLSVCTDAALGAVGGAVLLFIVSSILDQVTALGGLRSLLPTHYQNAYTDLLTQPVQWDEMARGTISALLYGAVFIALAWWRFLRKDVTS